MTATEAPSRASTSAMLTDGSAIDGRPEGTGPTSDTPLRSRWNSSAASPARITAISVPGASGATRRRSTSPTTTARLSPSTTGSTSSSREASSMALPTLEVAARLTPVREPS